MSVTVLEKPLGDLRREITDLRQVGNARDYDTSRLDRILTLSRESFRETESCQEQLLQQLKLFENAFADINQILRTTIDEKVRLEQKQPRSGKARDWRFVAMIERCHSSAKMPRRWQYGRRSCR